VQRLQGVRRVTAERLAHSARTVAAVTLSTEADATMLVQLRQQARAERCDSNNDDDVPGVTDLMIKIVALALAEHPGMNAELTEQGIVQHAQVHIAIAVDTPHGLIAPVVRDADARSVASVAREFKRLVGAARDGTSRPEDLDGATFTITNLGMYEIDVFTPMVNLPQCAILGLGRIIARPVVVDDTSEKVAVRRMLSLSLTFDHRLVDGAPAARFLQHVKHFVERPTLWLFR
jgi:pyruvate dehydrogenase E2 component (dihydrolipoamide acetyltransferase)